MFVDADHGQWGLKLLSPGASAAKSAEEQQERPADIAPGDVVVGHFLGDQDLLIVDDTGAVLIALPLDERSEWYRPTPNLAQFLDQYVAANGAKFWKGVSGRNLDCCRWRHMLIT